MTDRAVIAAFIEQRGETVAGATSAKRSLSRSSSNRSCSALAHARRKDRRGLHARGNAVRFQNAAGHQARDLAE
jgi:hypothetical protein